MPTISDLAARMTPEFVPNYAAAAWGQGAADFVGAYTKARQEAQLLRQQHDLQTQKLQMEQEKHRADLESHQAALEEHRQRMAAAPTPEEARSERDLHQRIMKAQAGEAEVRLKGMELEQSRQQEATDLGKRFEGIVTQYADFYGVPHQKAIQDLETGFQRASAQFAAQPSPITAATMAGAGEQLRQERERPAPALPPGFEAKIPMARGGFMELKGAALAKEREEIIPSAVINEVSRNADSLTDAALAMQSKNAAQFAALRQVRDAALESKIKSAAAKDAADEAKAQRQTLREEATRARTDFASAEAYFKKKRDELDEIDSEEPKWTDFLDKKGKFGDAEKTKFMAAKDRYLADRNGVLKQMHLASQDLLAKRGIADHYREQLRAAGALPTEPGAPAAPVAAAQAPAVGTVEDGYKFLGGDPADPKSWQKVK